LVEDLILSNARNIGQLYKKEARLLLRKPIVLCSLTELKVVTF